MRNFVLCIQIRFFMYRKKLLASPRVHLVLYIESLLRFWLTFPTCPSSVEITLERGTNRSTESIDFKIGLDLENWVIHVWKEWFLEIRIASCKLMQFMIICKWICVHGFDWSDVAENLYNCTFYDVASLKYSIISKLPLIIAILCNLRLYECHSWILSPSYYIIINVYCRLAVQSYCATHVLCNLIWCIE